MEIAGYARENVFAQFVCTDMEIHTSCINVKTIKYKSKLYEECRNL
jgi:vancomycin permeability regulator SanA